MKRFLFVIIGILLVAQSLSALPLDQAVGFNDAFKQKGTQHLSPLEGMNIQEIKSLRFHGRYSAQDFGFPQPEHPLLANTDKPMDEVAALIQRLFPSPAHDDLTPNNISSKKEAIRKWITPKNVAQLFNVTADHKAFGALSKEERLYEIMHALAEDFGAQSRQNKNKNLTKIQFLNKFGQNDKKPSKCIRKFAELLDTGLITTRDENHMHHDFYPKHIVERALLTFIVTKAENKIDLKPYFETLSADLCDKDLVNYDIKLTKDKYQAFVEKIYKDKSVSADNARDIATDVEKIIELSYGFAMYESLLPPLSSMGTVSYRDESGQQHLFSNCGETAAHNFMNALLFAPEKGMFDARRLTQEGANPLPALLDFYTKTQPSVETISDSAVQHAWAQLVSNLNRGSGEEIQYCKHSKPNHEGNGIYEMNAGVDNFVRIICRLLGLKNTKEMKKDTPEFYQNIQYNLNLISQLLSSERRPVDWYVKDVYGKNIDKIYNLDLIFTFAGKQSFQLHFGAGHFSFSDASMASDSWRSKLCNTIDSLENVPYQHHLSMLYYDYALSCMKDVEKRIFQFNLNQLEGRLKVLSVLSQNKELFEGKYGFLTKRWITPAGDFFGWWQDGHVQKTVLVALLKIYSFDEMKALNIKQLNNLLLPENINETFNHFVSSDQDIAAIFLAQPGFLENACACKENNTQIERLKQNIVHTIGNTKDMDVFDKFINIQSNRETPDFFMITAFLSGLYHSGSKMLTRALLNFKGVLSYIENNEEKLQKNYMYQSALDTVLKIDADDLIEKAITVTLDAGKEVSFNDLSQRFCLARKIEAKMWSLMEQHQKSPSNSTFSKWLVKAADELENLSEKTLYATDFTTGCDKGNLEFLLRKGATLEKGYEAKKFKEIDAALIPLIAKYNKKVAQEVIGEWFSQQCYDQILAVDSVLENLEFDLSPITLRGKHFQNSEQVELNKILLKNGALMDISSIDYKRVDPSMMPLIVKRDRSLGQEIISTWLVKGLQEKVVKLDLAKDVLKDAHEYDLVKFYEKPLCKSSLATYQKLVELGADLSEKEFSIDEFQDPDYRELFSFLLENNVKFNCELNGIYDFFGTPLTLDQLALYQSLDLFNIDLSEKRIKIQDLADPQLLPLITFLLEKDVKIFIGYDEHSKIDPVYLDLIQQHQPEELKKMILAYLEKGYIDVVLACKTDAPLFAELGLFETEYLYKTLVAQASYPLYEKCVSWGFDIGKVGSYTKENILKDADEKGRSFMKEVEACSE